MISSNHFLDLKGDHTRLDDRSIQAFVIVAPEDQAQGESGHLLALISLELKLRVSIGTDGTMQSLEDLTLVGKYNR